MLTPALQALLKAHSRSFYLSLRILPSRLRAPLSLAYLLARIADTVADTPLLPDSEREVFLKYFKNAINAIHEEKEDDKRRAFETYFLQNPSFLESNLLQKTLQALAALGFLKPRYRREVQNIVVQLIEGMLNNLRTFPGGSALEALKTSEELERYCYEAAGCVGEFWTALSLLSVPRLRSDSTELRVLGKYFGQGLQLINILQDLPRDLESGRCYLPEDSLKRYEVLPHDLKGLRSSEKLQPLISDMLQEAETALFQGLKYVERLPFGEIRLRLACAWPLLIGWKTLEHLKKEKNLFACPSKIKITRPELYLILLQSLILFPFSPRLKVLDRLQRRKIEGQKFTFFRG
jgi:farnesyl-diphosphate farnesyltransferase